MSFSSTTSLDIRAPLASVWDAITKPEIVKQYFFGTNLETDWKVGSPLFFRGEWQGKTYEDCGTVLSFEPMRSLSYDYWSGFSGLEDKPGLRQIIRYDLEPILDGVRIAIRQSNVDTQERADHSATNWSSVLEALKHLLEGKPAA
ncbi:MAG TPA: SRPBCC domain-containing protein [Polyangia bacterium]